MWLGSTLAAAGGLATRSAKGTAHGAIISGSGKWSESDFSQRLPLRQTKYSPV